MRIMTRFADLVLCAFFFLVLNDELQTTMQMCGVTRVDQCHPGLLYTAAIDHLVPEGEEHPYAKWRPKPRL